LWWVLVVQVQNVFILPGVPMLFEPLLEGLSSVVGGGVPITLLSVYTRQGEEDLAAHLEATLQQFPGLDIGSYPRLDRESDHKVRITLESRDATLCANATRWLLARLDASAVVRVEGL
jgi:molybdopterin-biosynthesis enzyme MoeA-like protein